ncbi:MAG: TetR/AcrR family transcriptional regulator [Thermonemataceae bacterium]
MMTMNDTKLSTKEKIKHAATKVFIDNGYDATKTRDIAKAAGVNISTLHYYYGTKEELFKVIVKEAFDEFFIIMNAIFDSELPLRDKLVAFVENCLTLAKKNPSISIFVFGEMQRNNEKVKELKELIPNQRLNDSIITTLDGLAQQGKIKPTNPKYFVANLLGLAIFPSLAKESLMAHLDFQDSEYEEFISNQPKIVADILLKSIEYK